MRERRTCHGKGKAAHPRCQEQAAACSGQPEFNPPGVPLRNWAGHHAELLSGAKQVSVCPPAPISHGLWVALETMTLLEF